MDLRVTDQTERLRLVDAVDRVLRHGRMVLGPEVQECERRVADRCGRRFAVGVSSGSTALHLAMACLDLGPGDEVITTSLSWIATANAIASVGATPVFVDIRDDLNMDPDRVREAITPRTRAILAVHWTGKICDMPAITRIAEEHGLLLIEDAAQAFDASLHGRKAGSFGTVGCFSMNSMKVLASCSDSGMVVTDREDLYNRLLSLRYAGTVNQEECVDVALNGRMDTLEAAILLVRLERLDDVIARRREIASWYKKGLAGVVETPRAGPGELDVWYTYTVRADRRDELRAFLDTRGVETKIHHPILMPDQPVYRGSARARTYPNANRLVKQIVSLPATEKASRSDVDYVVACVREFYGKAAGA